MDVSQTMLRNEQDGDKICSNIMIKRGPIRYISVPSFPSARIPLQINLMSEIDVVNDPDRTAPTARFACRPSSASFPEDFLEALHAELPNEAAPRSIIEPISLRVSSLVLPTIPGTTEPLVAPGKREKIRLYLALCQLS